MTMADVDSFTLSTSGPLDVFEAVFQSGDWVFERESEDELTAAVQGSWCTYQLKLIWREDDSALQLISLFDLRVPENRRAAVYETLGLINEQLWLGHFEMWAHEGDLMYRYAALVDPEFGVSDIYAENLVHGAIAECERFYPVFQFVLWAGKKPQEAMAAAMLETIGEA